MLCKCFSKSTGLEVVIWQKFHDIVIHGCVRIVFVHTPTHKPGHSHFFHKNDPVQKNIERIIVDALNFQPCPAVINVLLQLNRTSRPNQIKLFLLLI